MQGFGLRLENLREKYGYSKKEVSSKLGFTQNVYGSYEREKRRPSLETIIKLADIYKVSLDYLLRGKTYHANNRDQSNEVILREHSNAINLLMDNRDQSNEMILREVLQVFAEKEISNPYILQPEKWSILNNQEIKTLESHFEWMVDNAKAKH